MDLEYEVEADWVLLRTCNFRCDYCFVPVSARAAKITSYGTQAEWAEGFAATGKTWLLHITGGEPSLYPGFVELCEHLARDHYLSINSNLSHRCIDAFAERIDPKRVHYVNAALHYDEMHEASLAVFVKRVNRLQIRRFNVLVSVVMTPPMIDTFPEVSKHLESCGLFLIPKVMRQRYQGVQYPAAYSDSERSLLLDYLAEARRKYAPVITSMGEAPTIDMFADGRFLSSTGNYRGRWCASGYKFVRIQPDGTVVRCGSGKRLGNILLRNVRFLRAPKKCNASFCPYFCEKYTAPRFARMQEGADSSLIGAVSSLARGVLRNLALMRQQRP